MSLNVSKEYPRNILEYRRISKNITISQYSPSGTPSTRIASTRAVHSTALAPMAAAQRALTAAIAAERGRAWDTACARYAEVLCALAPLCRAGTDHRPLHQHGSGIHRRLDGHTMGVSHPDEAISTLVRSCGGAWLESFSSRGFGTCGRGSCQRLMLVDVLSWMWGGAVANASHALSARGRIPPTPPCVCGIVVVWVSLGAV